MRTPIVAAVAALSLLAVAPAPASAARGFVITGRGWGHGIGMSQYGAEGFALHDWSYRRILAHYYPGTRLERIASRTIRVLVAAHEQRVVVESKHPYRIRDASGRAWTLHPRRVVLAPGARVRIRGKRVRLRLPVDVRPGASPLGVDGRTYRGALRVVPDGRRLAVVNAVRLEFYVRGVVSWEMPYRWDGDALAAQAVAARSYAVSQIGSRPAFDVYADTRDQMYGGIHAETPPTNRAVARTARRVLTWHGAVAHTYYSSTSGGRTQGVPGVPYLRSVSDPYDRISPQHLWGPLQYSSRRLGRLLDVPAPTAVQVIRNGYGRARSVYLRWHGGGSRLAADDFKARLGLRSTWFWVGKLGPTRRAGVARARVTGRSRRSARVHRQQRRPHRPA